MLIEYQHTNKIYHDSYAPASQCRETSDPSGTAHNEQNNKPKTAPLVPGTRLVT